jgi:shikimate dehydrogenase
VVIGEGRSPGVSGTTQLYGIFGYPVAHSLSPLMHMLAFRQHSMDCLYVPFPVPPERLDAAVAGAVALGVCGFNVTIPHKEAIVPLLDEVSAAAGFVGAVNTVHIVAGRTIGYNTDGEGFMQPLRALHLPFAETSVCVLGAGGAARAITMALLQAGCPVLAVANRTYARGQRLVMALQERFPQAQLSVVPWPQAAPVVQRSMLIVNATAVGLHAEGEALLPASCFGAGQVVYDIVYRPLHTPLLQVARERGATVVGGLDMLIGQGAEAFRIWTGRPFPVALARHELTVLLQAAA